MVRRGGGSVRVDRSRGRVRSGVEEPLGLLLEICDVVFIDYEAKLELAQNKF